jgi:endoglucanase
MGKLLFFLIILINASGEMISQLNKPFPQNEVYCLNSIKPNSISIDNMNSTVKDFYLKWKAQYLRNDCPNHPDWYYVWSDDTPYLPDLICVSEGIGYGMIITTLMAGFDPDAKKIFDGLYCFYKAHPSQSYPNSHLMSWVQITGCEDAAQADRTSATDGDIDIAYALLMAHIQWGGNGEVKYLLSAYDVLSDILLYDVNTDVYNLKLGDAIQSDDSKAFDTRSSDFIPYFFRQFLNHNGSKEIISKGYEIFTNIQAQNSSGLIPDFIINCNADPIPAPPNYLESKYDGCYSYNACRVPFRIGLDFLHSGSQSAKDVLTKINDFFINNTGWDPGKIYSGYTLDGKVIPGKDFNDLAFISPLGVSAMIDSKYQGWLNSLWIVINSIKFEDSKYYGNTIKILSLLTMSGNFWTPQLQSGLNDFEKIDRGITALYNNQVISLRLNTRLDENAEINLISLSGVRYKPDDVIINVINNEKSALFFKTPNLQIGFYLLEIEIKGKYSIYYKLLLLNM